jgi:transmembrane sensor
LKKIDYRLISKFRSGKATDAEKKELLEWYRAVADRESEFPEDEFTVEKYMLQRLMRAAGKTPKKSTPLYWLAAASIALVFCVTTFYLTSKNSNVPVKNTIVKVLPGGDKAVLILPNGLQVSLNDKAQHDIPVQRGIEVHKNTGGQIRYSLLPPEKRAEQQADTATVYNTIKTPAGGQFKIVLSDGTKVWLNAMSSLKFPVNFSSKKDRSVILAGEGYFEVHPNAKQPFKVTSKNQLIEVLGTHFNVNAYQDEEDVKTVLLEGAVKVSSGHLAVKLVPGQEASFRKQFKISNVNTDYAVAWKAGQFRFDGERLEVIMKTISRWYNVKVSYEDESLKNELYGVLSDRVSDLSAMLKIMEQTGEVKFRISGATVYVMKNKPPL